MIKIAMSVEAFEAICATLPLGSVANEAEIDAKGLRHVAERCLAHAVGTSAVAGL
jgi:hypothetical protein